MVVPLAFSNSLIRELPEKVNLIADDTGGHAVGRIHQDEDEIRGLLACVYREMAEDFIEDLESKVTSQKNFQVSEVEFEQARQIAKQMRFQDGEEKRCVIVVTSPDAESLQTNDDFYVHWVD